MGLGCWGMSGPYGESDDAEALRTFDRALELGITFLDTADTYGSGHNEEFVGRALRGPPRSRRPRDQIRPHLRAAGARGVDGRPEYVRSACDASLKRLGVDTIDLYYQHRVDKTVPIEETVGAMAELKAAGKIRYLGLSEANADNVRRAAAVHPIAALESEYSLFSRDIEDNGVLADDSRARHRARALQPARPRHAQRHRAHERRLRTVAIRARATRASKATTSPRTWRSSTGSRRSPAKLGLTGAQLALAWLYAQGDDIIPIPGTKRVTYLEENAAAADVRLTAGRARAHRRDRAQRRRRRRAQQRSDHRRLRNRGVTPPPLLQRQR